MKKFVEENKIFATISVCILGFIISWGIWTTCSLFSQDKNQALSAEHNKTITKSVEEVRSDLKEFKGEVKQEFNKVKDKIDGNQEKVINILMQVDKRSKSIEKKINDK